MKLQTKIPFKKQDNNRIDYKSKVLLLGSCFAENIGDKFKYYKFQNYVNPFGILFHPKAIESLVTNALNSKKYTEDDVFFNNEQFHCFDAHSKLSNASTEKLLKNLNTQIQSANQQITTSTHVIITLGTAWVYSLIEANTIVANCHKMPQQKFQKELLSVQEVRASLESIIEQITAVNPKVNFIFTVSPVRHIKDGFVENTQSKSHLITAIHQVINGNSYYFPSFEIMMDELRDYRFYNQDMLHPNPLALDYIWNRFKDVWINTSVVKTMDEVANIQKGMLHKSFNSNSKAHLKFVEQLKEKQKKLNNEFPFINFTE